MAAQDDTVLEAEDEVLSGRLDAEQPATVEALGEPLDRRPRVWRLDLDPRADATTLQGRGGGRRRGDGLGIARADRSADFSLRLLGHRRAWQRSDARPALAACRVRPA